MDAVVVDTFLQEALDDLLRHLVFETHCFCHISDVQLLDEGQVHDKCISHQLVS